MHPRPARTTSQLTKKRQKQAYRNRTMLLIILTETATMEKAVRMMKTVAAHSTWTPVR